MSRRKKAARRRALQHGLLPAAVPPSPQQTMELPIRPAPAQRPVDNAARHNSAATQTIGNGSVPGDGSKVAPVAAAPLPSASDGLALSDEYSSDGSTVGKSIYTWPEGSLESAKSGFRYRWVQIIYSCIRRHLKWFVVHAAPMLPTLTLSPGCCVDLYRADYTSGLWRLEQASEQGHREWQNPWKIQGVYRCQWKLTFGIVAQLIGRIGSHTAQLEAEEFQMESQDAHGSV